MGKYVKEAEAATIEVTGTTNADICKAYRKAIAQLQLQLKDYEADYAKMQDAAKALGVVYGFVDDTNYTLKALENQVEKIANMGTEDQVPGFEKLFQGFSSITTEDIKTEITNTNNFMNKIDEVGNLCNTIMDEIGDEVEKLKRNIEIYNQSIQSLQITQ